jgi:predicted nucleic acid-binding protein
MTKIYLDMNIYNRPYDDQTQTRIKLETIAVFAILQKIRNRDILLVWSFMVDYENSLNPYDDIRMEIDHLSELASEYVLATEIVHNRAKIYESKGLKPRDALHLACAVTSGAKYFLTCDDRVIKKQHILDIAMTILNPIDFIRQQEDKKYDSND